MAYFGRRPEKPGSTPGAGSGARDQEAAARVRAAMERLERRREEGRRIRAARAGNPVRSERSAR